MLHDVAGGEKEQLTPPGEAVTVYEVIGAPPVLPCSVTETVAVPFPVVIPVMVGASGVVREVTVTVAGADVPTAFTATTVNVVGVPLVKPLTLTGLEEAVKVSPVAVFVTI